MLTISLVLYKNDISTLKALFESINFFKEDYIFYIIDNSPTDELSSVCDDSKMVYIFNDANIGYGAAHNIAIDKAFLVGSEYHLVINPDIYFGEGTLEKIIDFMNSNYAIGNLMPKVLYPDGSLQYLCKLLPTPFDWIGRRFSPFKKYVEKRNELFELRFCGYNKIMDVPYLSGCFMFLRTSVLKEVGLFDTSIFMYGEETDLCRRMINKGYRTTFYPEATIYHEFQKGSHKTIKLTWIGIKSAIYYFNKWGWFFDKERTGINRKILHDLNYLE
jgi:GT2 family glycosyltransferase